MAEELPVVSATLNIEMFATCPNDECGFYIDLLSDRDTDDKDHNEEGFLLNQMFHPMRSHEQFECNDVVCTECKTKFNVRVLEW